MADVANEYGVDSGREIEWVWNKYGKNTNAWGYRLATGKACGQGTRGLGRCCAKPRPPRESSGQGLVIQPTTVSKIRAKTSRNRRSAPNATSAAMSKKLRSKADHASTARETGGLADSNAGIILADLVATRSLPIVLSAILTLALFFRTAIGLGGYSGQTPSHFNLLLLDFILNHIVLFTLWWLAADGQDKEHRRCMVTMRPSDIGWRSRCIYPLKNGTSTTFSGGDSITLPSPPT